MDGYLVECTNDKETWPVKVFLNEQKATEFIHKMSAKLDDYEDVNKYWSYRIIEVITR